MYCKLIQHPLREEVSPCVRKIPRQLTYPLLAAHSHIVARGVGELCQINGGPAAEDPRLLHARYTQPKVRYQLQQIARDQVPVSGAK